MDPIDMAQAGALVAAVGVGLALFARARSPLYAGVGLIAVGEGLLVHGAGSVDVSAKLAGAAVLAAVFALAAAVLLARHPVLVLPLILLAAPFRLPLEFEPHHRFFVAVAGPGQLGRLLPLYAVLAVAAIELCWRSVRTGRVVAVPAMLAVPATAFLGLASVSLSWSNDEPKGRTVLAFFLVPFGVLVAVGARAVWARWLPRVLAIEAVALAAVFSVIGIWEAATHKLLFFTPSLEVSNAYTSYFRVTSLFRDPSLYGRHVILAITIVVVAIFMRRLDLVAGALIVGLLWTGLFFSYSQSSLLSLFAVVIAVALVAGDRLGRRAVAVVAIVSALAATGLVVASVGEASAQRATSDRSRRVELTARVFRDHPLAGVGVGAQPHASQLVSPRPGPQATFVSHTTPLTVAAELGIVGVLAYLAFLAGSIRLLLDAHRLWPALGLALGAVLLALFVHSLFYSGFFEDPVTWLALAIAANVVAHRRVEPA